MNSANPAVILDSYSGLEARLTVNTTAPSVHDVYILHVRFRYPQIYTIYTDGHKLAANNQPIVYTIKYNQELPR